MRLVLTVISPLGVIEVDTDQEMVDLLGIRGAIRMLKNRAFSQIPGIQRADCQTSISYSKARSTLKSAASEVSTQRLTVSPTEVWASEPGGVLDCANWECPICRHRNECTHWAGGSSEEVTDKCHKCGVTSIVSGRFPGLDARLAS